MVIYDVLQVEFAMKIHEYKFILIDQLNEELRSFWSFWMSSKEMICRKHFVPSANSSSCDMMVDGRSFIKTSKSRGPRMLPRGTPEITGRKFDKQPSIETHWDLLLK